MKIKLTGRLSFPDLFEAKQYQGQGPFNYRATVLIPKSDKAQLKKFEDTVAAVATGKWAAKAAAVVAACRADSKKFCLADGDAKEYDGYADHFALAATRNKEKGRPDIRDADGKTPLVAGDGRPYAGCYVDMIVEIWPQENKFGKGIRAELIGMQFRKDGDSFGAGSAASDDDFESIAEGTDADSLV